MSEYSASGGVAEIIIRDVSALTRHDVAAAKELRDAIWDANDDNDVKVIVLRSGGRGDFSPKLTDKQQDDIRSNFTVLQDAYYGPHGLYQAVSYPKKVIVLEVSGECAGAGALLALYADIVIASDDATFHNPSIDLPGTNAVVPILLVGLHRAKAWALTGQVLSTTEAASWGLVNYVVSRDELAAKTNATAGRIARMPLDALTSTKMGFNAVADASGANEDFTMSGFYAASGQALS